ncbi:sigma-54 dependent transcriptional regulator [Lentimicrobium sp. S6]|uniref:sigma-54-dependent transcriptional regulator n=1 Tax=Lentimicrobium sp. S6 TaxID=2735872 RepID=UPI001555B51A|nr:sigma-54 dependent transcriptional regulator [Lentimicrobium sp. S6]NPD46529.1 sigma-54-dependent Fis family transcriptional regulator [Lentimicrobium sp. S6]
MNRKNKYQILAVDDSLEMLELLRRNLKSCGYNIITVSSVIDATKVLESTEIDLVITDLQMPQINGIELIKHLKENYKNTGILVITGYPSIKNAVETVKLGANDYLIKSFTRDELINAVEKSLLTVENQKEKEEENHYQIQIDGIIGNSKAMQAIFKDLLKASRIKTTILLNGETGTGKELVARAIHYNSKESTAPFIPVNCGGIPEALLESELFGYLKGAFTGATETRGGFFQAADGGSIFLDEIHNTSMSMQAKLLRVLQEKEINMIGSNHAQKINVRVIAAANVDLFQLVKKKLFREDLYYRLNIIPISIPPLRERDGDINILIRYFSLKYAKENGLKNPRFTDRVLQILNNYDWPGNVRELENIVHRLVVMSDGSKIDVPDLPVMMRHSIQSHNNLNKSLKEVETEHIQMILAYVGGNKTKASEILGIDRKTLRERLKTIENSLNLIQE